MDAADANEKKGVSRGSQFGKQFLIWFGVAFIAFLLGFVPMWWGKRGVTNELGQTKRELTRQQFLNSLSAAAVYSRRGEYETARQNASTFFTDVQKEMDNPDPQAFTSQERTQVPGVLSARDEVITLLSRGDPASADKLSDLYLAYRAITASKPAQ